MWKRNLDPYKKKDKNRMTSIELNFFRRTVGYTLFEHKRNE